MSYLSAAGQSVESCELRHDLESFGPKPVEPIGEKSLFHDLKETLTPVPVKTIKPAKDKEELRRSLNNLGFSIEAGEL